MKWGKKTHTHAGIQHTRNTKNNDNVNKSATMFILTRIKISHSVNHTHIWLMFAANVRWSCCILSDLNVFLSNTKYVPVNYIHVAYMWHKGKTSNVLTMRSPINKNNKMKLLHVSRVSSVCVCDRCSVSACILKLKWLRLAQVTLLL